MSAVPASQQRQRRYRRRIVGWGAVGLLVVFAIGAAIFGNRVEDDLERRTVDVLTAAGIGPVTVRFSGQDGSLICFNGAVRIPDEVLLQARGLWGVHSLQVEASCEDSSDDLADLEVSTTESPEPDAPLATDATVTSEPDTPTTLEVPDTILDVIASDSQFSELRGLVGDADLVATLGEDGPFTLFAPTNAAIQALGPDVIAALGRDPDLLAIVLSHHLTAGKMLAADITGGDITMVDGTTVGVEIGAAVGADVEAVEDEAGAAVVLSSADSVARITEADLLASNGVVHAIDQVLIPAGVEVDPAASEPIATATLDDGQITLLGALASEAQRAEVFAAAATGLDEANLMDGLTVSSTAAVSDERATAFSSLVAAMSSHLIGGEVTLTPIDLTLRGVYVDAAARAAVAAAAAAVDVMPDLTERADASDADAAALEADLNEFVAANPVLFDPGSTTISPASAAVLDRVASIANRLTGVAIEIRGHTDTDGAAAANQLLSEGRAAAVLEALVARGVAPETLRATGLGGTAPVLDAAGIEDKVASRRVEFAVSTT